MLAFLILLLVLTAFTTEFLRKANLNPRVGGWADGVKTGGRRLFRKMAFGGQYWTLMTGLGVTNLGTTFTHSLGITPSLLFARVNIHQAVVTNTAPALICTIGTNIITIAVGVGILTTVDLEVGQQHSLIS